MKEGYIEGIEGRRNDTNMFLFILKENLVKMGLHYNTTVGRGMGTVDDQFYISSGGTTSIIMHIKQDYLSCSCLLEDSHLDPAAIFPQWANYLR